MFTFHVKGLPTTPVSAMADFPKPKKGGSSKKKKEEEADSEDDFEEERPQPNKKRGRATPKAKESVSGPTKEVPPPAPEEDDSFVDEEFEPVGIFVFAPPRLSEFTRTTRHYLL
jgi:hypothetical protein